MGQYNFRSFPLKTKVDEATVCHAHESQEGLEGLEYIEGDYDMHLIVVLTY